MCAVLPARCVVCAVWRRLLAILGLGLLAGDGQIVGLERPRRQLVGVRDHLPRELEAIGAAMALYNRRFILLVERGVTLPSNLQGLYKVYYEGDGLDYDSTTRLLEAFADFKNAPVE